MLTTLKKIKRRLLGLPARDTSGPYSCPVCKKSNVGMDHFPVYFLQEAYKHQHIHNIFLTETVNFDAYSCKNCGAADRDRLYALYLEDYFSKKTEITLLDIAPAVPLANFIRSYANVKYRSMDLYMEGVDDHLDITDMHLYKEGQFDFIICSHVLEHIPNDIRAMEEMYRILKKGGQGIMMVPINLGVLETHEDSSLSSVSDRWKYYGQDDHVRMYAKKDFIERLTSVGFRVDQLGVSHFGASKFKDVAINDISTLYIVTK